MNMRTFVSSLTLSEMNELSNIIYETRKEIIANNLKDYPPVDVDLIELCRSGQKVKAIIEYKQRNNLSLYEAKTVIDVYSV